VKRAQLEHIVRAAAGVATNRGLLIIGSQSVLGTFPSFGCDDGGNPSEAIEG